MRRLLGSHWSPNPVLLSSILRRRATGSGLARVTEQQPSTTCRRPVRPVNSVASTGYSVVSYATRRAFNSLRYHACLEHGNVFPG